MQENNDGGFGEILELEEAKERFLKDLLAGTAKNFYTGSEEELKAKQEEETIKKRVEDIEYKLREMRSVIKKPCESFVKQIIKTKNGR